MEKTTSNASKLKLLTERQSRSIIDLQPICIGPVYTFHVDRVGTSYIDHCIASYRLIDKVISCQVLEETIINTSDHLPVRLTIDIVLPKVTYSNQNRVPTIAWNRLSESELYQLYTVPLENELHRLYTEYVSTDLGSNDTPIIYSL